MISRITTRFSEQTVYRKIVFRTTHENIDELVTEVYDFCEMIAFKNEVKQMKKRKMLRKLSAAILAGAMVITVPNALTVNALAAKNTAKITISSVKETGSAAITLSWKKVKSAKKYKVLRATKKNGKGAKTIGTVSKTRFVDKSTADGKTYYYSIRASKAASSWKKFKTSGSPVLGDLQSDLSGISAGATEKSNFTIDIKNFRRVKKNAVKLYSGDRQLGTFHDDGKNGDAEQNDGTYTCSQTINAKDSDKSLSFTAKLGSKSKTLSITVVAESSTDELSSDLKSVQNGFQEITDKYADKDGYISFTDLPKALADAETYANTLKDNGTVTEINKTSSAVNVRLSNGVIYSYAPSVQGLKSGGNDVSFTTVAYKPFYGTQNLFNNHYPENALSTVTTKVPGVNEGKTYSRDQVNDSTVLSIKDHQLVYWDGHGTFSKLYGGIVWSGVNAFDYLDNNPNSSELFVNGELAISTSEDLGYTGKFFEDNLNSSSNYLKGTIIYVSACQTGMDKRFADPFIRRGATVIGFNDSVSSYSDDLGSELFKNLSAKDPDTDEYYTVGAALSKAQNDIGADENSYMAQKQRNAGYSVDTESYISWKEYNDVNATAILYGSYKNGLSGSTDSSSASDNDNQGNDSQSGNNQDNNSQNNNSSTSTGLQDDSSYVKPSTGQKTEAFKALKKKIQTEGTSESDGSKVLDISESSDSYYSVYTVKTKLKDDYIQFYFKREDKSGKNTDEAGFTLNGDKNGTIRPSIYSHASYRQQNLSGIASRDYAISSLRGVSGEVQFDITPAAYASTYQSSAYSLFSSAEFWINNALKENCRMSLGDFGFGNYSTYDRFTHVTDDEDNGNGQSNNNGNNSGNNSSDNSSNNSGNGSSSGNNSGNGGSQTVADSGLSKLIDFVKKNGTDSEYVAANPYNSKQVVTVRLLSSSSVELKWNNYDTGLTNGVSEAKFVLDGSGKISPEVSLTGGTPIDFKARADRSYDISTLVYDHIDMGFNIVSGNTNSEALAQAYMDSALLSMQFTFKKTMGIQLKDLGFTRYYN